MQDKKQKKESKKNKPEPFSVVPPILQRLMNGELVVAQHKLIIIEKVINSHSKAELDKVLPDLKTLRAIFSS